MVAEFSSFPISYVPKFTHEWLLFKLNTKVFIQTTNKVLNISLSCS